MPTIRANGFEVNYELRGPAGAPVVVFVNALGATQAMWREQTAALAGRYRCLTYDAHGHGGSTPKQAPPTIAALAEDLRAVVDALGIGRFVLVGASIGGMTAQAFAARWPERLVRLVLLTTSAKYPDPAPWNARAADVRANGLDALATATMTPRWFTAAFAHDRPDRVAEIRRAFVATNRESYALCAEAVGAADLRESAATIRAPTLVLAAAADPGTPPEMARDLRDRIPGATLVVIPDAAHMAAIERAAEVAAYVAAFLDLGAGTEAVAVAVAVGAADAGPGDTPEVTAGASGTRPATVGEGLANRRAVLGDNYVDRALAASGEFGAPWQAFVSRIAWGEAWGDPALSWKARSLVTLALLAALNREEEFRIHIRGALRNGVTRRELQALLRHVAAYAGAAAGNNANRWAVAALAEGEGGAG